MNKRTLGRAVAIAALTVSAAAMGENMVNRTSYQGLVADPRAHGVGDLLTVLLVESTTAESRADTSEDAEYSLEAGVQDASGLGRGAVSLGSESTGKGRTARSGRLRGQVSVRVEQAADGGLLQVRGEQLITINGEQQTIRVEGLARPVDIGADNTILSTRLLNARIEYTGEGWVARNQKNGWLRRLFVFLGL